MSKSDHKYVNFNQDYELNYILHKCGFSKTKENRNTLSSLRDKALSWNNKWTGQNLTHDELCNYLYHNYCENKNSIMDHEYVNFEQDYELNYVLRKIGCLATEANRQQLRTLKVHALSFNSKKSYQDITHDELFDYLSSCLPYTELATSG